MSCVPAVPGSACTQNIYFTDSNGVKQQATISIDLTGQFLKIIKFRKAGAGFNKEFKPGTEEFDNFMQDTAFQEGYRNKVSEVKGEVEKAGGNQVRRARSAANVNGTTDIWDGTTAGGGYYNPAPDPGTVTPQAGAEPTNSEVATKEQLDAEAVSGADASTQVQPLSFPKQDIPQFTKYPADANYANSQDSILIEQFEYVAPQKDLLFTDGAISGSSFFNNIQQGLQRNTNITKKPVGAVRLPIPNDISSRNNVEWGGGKANAFQAAAFYGGMGLANKVLQGDFLGAGSDVVGGLKDGFGMIKGGGLGEGSDMGLLLTALATQYGLGKVGINVDPAQFISRATGTRINPNLELLFTAPTLRAFSFTFEFAPADAADARAVRRIMRFFKQGMAPKKNNERLIFIGSPNVFRVKYKNGDLDIKGLNSHKICALTECNIDFTPDNIYQAYADPNAVSQPVTSTMNLTFQELTPIFQQDYQAGSAQANGAETDQAVRDSGIAFSDDSVGF